MSRLEETLLYIPPILCVLAWLLTQSWTAATEGQPRPRLLVWWRKHEFGIYLGTIFATMLAILLLDHKI